MGTDRRINVASGRSLEKQAHYSRAVRVRDLVLQSGTTAIDRQGSVRGVGDVAKQVETIMTIAEWSLGKAGGKLADVVRSRIYVTDIGMADRAARTLARYLRDARPAATLVQVNRLARPEQLVEIELDAVDGAGATARRISSGARDRRRVRVLTRGARGRPRARLREHGAERAGCRRRQGRPLSADAQAPWTRSSGPSGRPAPRARTSSTPRRFSPTSRAPRTTRGPGSKRSATCGPPRRCSVSRRSCSRRC